PFDPTIHEALMHSYAPDVTETTCVAILQPGYRDLLQHATAFECDEVLLEVRVDNTRAQKLYERFGFEPIGFRRGYYQPGNVDALVMRLTVQGTGTDI
ncbi:GNAT family N-acetyltransferase, partial [Streptomyces sp. NPDC000963]